MRKNNSRGTYGVLARLIGLFVVVLWAGCGGEGETDAPAAAMTQAQRDSVLAASPLPGAGVVGRAIDVADSARLRADLLDAAYK